MNRQEVINKAREAGFGPAVEGPEFRLLFERFAALVATAAREECAKLCDVKSAEQDEWMAKAGADREQFSTAWGRQDTADELAAAFRAMGNEGGAG